MWLGSFVMEGPSKMLHIMNPMRLKFIRDRVSLQDKRIIDIGCGGGILSESMARAGGNVTGIDISEKIINVARLHALKTNLQIDYQLITAEMMATKKPHQFDVVTCFELLEHVPDPSAIIQACATLVKPDGHAFFATVNRSLKTYLVAIVGAEYLTKLLPYHTHEYEKFIRPDEFEQWARQAHLKTHELIGLHYYSFTRTCSLTSDISVNYLAHCQPE